MSTNRTPFENHHHWVSPFDSSRFDEFYSLPMRQAAKKGSLGEVYPMENGDFRWKCDVSGYLPEELRIGVDGNELVVIGEHEDTRDGELVYRQLKRRVALPEGIDKRAIKCHIDHHFHLMIEADLHPEKVDIEVIPADRYWLPFYM
ncbi:small HSP21-like protein [Aphelenchoides avenae]|nr:small HSP21-like protein [Aphelenchus avenae]